MEANELRIGNYVELLGKVRKVECISNLPARKEMYWLTCENMIDTKIIHFSPIPLTEEWLGKFNWNGYKPLHFNSNFEIDKQGRLYCNGDYKGVNINYVHQLQNLYFALTGKELIIK